MKKPEALRKYRILRTIVLIAIAAATILWLNINAVPTPPTTGPVAEIGFEGNSEELEATQIVATLDTPIEKRKNAIWCASFLAAWKNLETELLEEPATFDDALEIANRLSNAPDPQPGIPESCLYAATGWINKGITDQIAKDLAERFPGKTPPIFPELGPNAFVSYAYLEANVMFSIPYMQSEEPLVFTDNSGKQTKLDSFYTSPPGIVHFDPRQQTQVLFADRDNDGNLTEFAIDLDRTSQPSQIVLALIDLKPTLAEMLADIQNRIKTFPKPTDDHVTDIDVLQVPDMVWDITHRFTELEGSEFTNENIEKEARFIELALQKIQFRLDRSGAQLKSEACVDYPAAIPTHYIFNRPFLLYMKKRGADQPYFVMWVENAELLNRWDADSPQDATVPATTRGDSL